ncbi:MAG: CBS domain-containing protein [Nanoarchaeota archaeon]|nr:CBS domain-containing protein [Nanoarchaeota archaeon]MBU1704037.1 CBS domain-containing protein [Nanoarchaeota archaeon]
MEIEEIKQIRKRLGMTQNQLAKAANVSQSLIAKIESGRLDPTFSNAQKIFQALKDFGKHKELKAKDVMTARIISVGPESTIKNAIDVMRKHSISQLPVIQEEKSVGLVSESVILNAMLEGKGKKVKDIMDDSPPVISRKTSVSVVSSLLQFFPLVLVSDEGILKGLITKSDLLGKVYR